MSTKTEGKHNLEFLVSEANGYRSRDKVTVTVPANTTLAPGYVLAKLSATGKFVPYDNSGSDGSEAAAGVNANELVNATGSPLDVVATVFVRHAEVRDADLEWEGTVDSTGKTAGKADLAAIGIIAR